MIEDVGMTEVVSIDNTRTLNSPEIAKWKVKIVASWKSAAEGILLVSKQLYDARKALKAKDRLLWQQLQTELHDENIISEAIQKKLLVIGEKHGTLLPFSGHLPPRYNAIYELSELPSKRLQKLVGQKAISPSMEDKAIRELFAATSTALSKSANNKVILAKVLREKRLSTDAKATLKKLLNQLVNIDGLEVKLSAEGEKLVGDDEK